MMQDHNHAEEITKITRDSKHRTQLFLSLPLQQRGFVLLNLSKHVQKKILSQLSTQQIIETLTVLDSDKVTDIVQILEDDDQKTQVIHALEQSIKEKVEFLLSFNPRTAAGIMSLDYVQVEIDTTFKEVSEVIRHHEKRSGKNPTILVLNKGVLQGELPSHILALREPNENIQPFIKRIPRIRYDKDKSEVVRVFKNNPHHKIVVLDELKSVIGIIYSDDVLRTLDEQAGTSLYDFAGVNKEESITDSIASKVKNRYKWLILNLATAFLAASIVSLFQETIQAFVLLAVYMPIVAGMGGNAGTQTLAVMVRGIALKEVELRTAKPVITKELIAGIINGIIIGVIVAAFASILNQNPLLGVIIGVSMIITLFVAGLFGSLVPLIMKSLGKDPATSAAIFITTATDLTGFFTFLGLASIVL